MLNKPVFAIGENVVSHSCFAPILELVKKFSVGDTEPVRFQWTTSHKLIEMFLLQL